MNSLADGIPTAKFSNWHSTLTADVTAQSSVCTSRAELSTVTEAANESSSSKLRIATGAATRARRSIGLNPRIPLFVGFPSEFPLHPAKIVAACDARNAINDDQIQAAPLLSM